MYMSHGKSWIQKADRLMCTMAWVLGNEMMSCNVKCLDPEASLPPLPLLSVLLMLTLVLNLCTVSILSLNPLLNCSSAHNPTPVTELE